ncbi:unnamed protein product [Citrullus colocynthis]|uniref:Uncharacterized protein n=1 Tax=Citrullus colocynthis TaxID=252529 RepID=A0ABP0Z5Z0_9ROSI
MEKKSYYLLQCRNLTNNNITRKDDWNTAERIFKNDASAFSKKIAARQNTALHIAAAAKNISFVENMVHLSSVSDLAIKDIHGRTALAHADTSGVVRIAEAMVNKNPDLPNVHDRVKRTTVSMAIVYKQKHMASYLFSKTNLEL